MAWTPWVELAAKLKPAVVNISTTRVEPGTSGPQSSSRGDDPLDQFFHQFFGDQPPHTVHSLGSGFIIDPNGYVVTNDHVVDGATLITVKLSDGRELPGTIVGRDARTDLALVKIDASGLPIVPLGTSAEVQVGEPVMAIGNPFGLEQTVTTGIVSAIGRVIGAGPYDQFVQTDASINPGNSGGPLINTSGQAIAINTAIFSRDGGSNGVGFAIPITLAKAGRVRAAADAGPRHQPARAGHQRGPGRLGRPRLTGDEGRRQAGRRHRGVQRAPRRAGDGARQGGRGDAGRPAGAHHRAAGRHARAAERGDRAAGRDA
jgi:S1-C subfamily serine protease